MLTSGGIKGVWSEAFVLPPHVGHSRQNDRRELQQEAHVYLQRGPASSSLKLIYVMYLVLECSKQVSFSEGISILISNRARWASLAPATCLDKKDTLLCLPNLTGVSGAEGCI